MPELWRDIESYEGLYQVSNYGRVKSLNYARTGKARNLRLGKHRQGYREAHLSKEGKTKIFKVHRLVASAFIPNPENKKEVNHIDEVSSNNRMDNLEWVTPSENMNHGTRNRRVAAKISIPIVQIDMSGEVVHRFASAAEAGRQGFDSSHIVKCCRGILTTHRGYCWEYESEMI